MCPPESFWFFAGFGVMMLCVGLGLAALTHAEVDL